MPSVPSFGTSTDTLPRGLDRADGIDGRLGTPTPQGAIIYDSPSGKNSSVPINELPTSPTMERSEQCTIRNSFTGDYAEMLNRWSVYPRGTLVIDSGGNFFRVLSTNLSRFPKGDIGQLDITTEALSFDSPPDEFCCNTVDLGLDLLKNPRYFYSLIPTSQIPPGQHPPGIVLDDAVQEQVKSTIIRAIQAYRENPLVPPAAMYDNVSGFFHDLIIQNLHPDNGITYYTVRNPNFNPALKPTEDTGTKYSGDKSDWPAAATSSGQPNLPILYITYDYGNDPDPGDKVALALAAAQEILCKLWKREDSPPVYGLEICWSEYYWRPPYLNLGSYIEDPAFATPSLPPYFTCPAALPDGSTMFDLIGNFNPQYYSVNGESGGGVNISWLRQADTLEFSRTFFKITRRWIGAPVGCWDADLFNQNPRPSKVGDYKKLLTV